ncbi:phosphotransferase [Caulobacter sp. CCUG 60055]|uniref:phosphotransferase n=1 Tax=Caulobacter sp. CCUG 60055 TaxID=2100090 RepID=UPI001FA70896|nr:phosphotransferase [Caulobacter sp. CCUG 60055]MBQ1543157.1 phosphotransferase [Caulobacteraceae bacterium]
MTSLPPEKRAAVARGLTAAFGPGAEIDGLVPVGGGLSRADIFRIRVGGVAYLLRIEAERTHFGDPARGYACMRIAADALLAPRVRYACAEDGVAILDFIPERSLLLDYAGTRADLIAELAQAARLLHAAPAFPPLIDFLDGMDVLIAQQRAASVLDDAELDAPLSLYAELARIYRGLEPAPVSSHNDLNPRNILYDGRRLWLVDWEAAFLADRYFDLAALANFFTATPEEEVLLQATYWSAPPREAQAARLYLARQVNHLYYALAFLNLAAAERPGLAVRDAGPPPVLADLHAVMRAGEPVLGSAEGRLAYGRARLGAALDGLRDPRFDEAARLAR